MSLKNCGHSVGKLMSFFNDFSSLFDFIYENRVYCHVSSRCKTGFETFFFYQTMFVRQPNVACVCHCGIEFEKSNRR